MSGRDSLLDVPGLRVGHWTDLSAATGCTVILAPDAGVAAAASVRGGAPGTRETDLLRPENTVQRIHAVLLTGGSAFGLNAAGGVMRYLEERGVGHEMKAGRVPIVVGAVVYDLGVGDARIRPGECEGYLACTTATGDALSQGTVGAGTGATVAKAGGIERAMKGGLGSASERLFDGTIVAALAVVNAIGDITEYQTGFCVRPRPNLDGTVESALDIFRSRGSRPPGQEPAPEETANTTLVVIGTTAPLTKAQLLRVAEMGHAGLARAIQPSHAPGDGDVVFALSCPPIEPPAGDPDLTAIGALAARAVSRAIVRGVQTASSVAGIPSVGQSIELSPTDGTG